MARLDRSGRARPNEATLALMRARSVLFWDFDGVIKESVAIKADAYEQLFLSFGESVARRVRAHHEANGGMSRFEKIPLYLQWAGAAASAVETERYCALFSAAVLQAVIDSPWVPGAREYLETNHRRQRCVLISATPQQEIEEITRALGIAPYFCAIHGAPAAKRDSVGAALARWACARERALVIGDSQSDYEAAVAAGVEFLLRRTPLNRALQCEHAGPQCGDFSDG
jgi:HAD superfamily hydrolase (TIGR01549 family)